MLYLILNTGMTNVTINPTKQKTKYGTINDLNLFFTNVLRFSFLINTPERIKTLAYEKKKSNYAYHLPDTHSAQL